MNENGFDDNYKGLPPTKTELFQLNAYPVLDKIKGMSCVGNDVDIYQDLVFSFQNQLPVSELEFITAYENNDWRKIKFLADRESDGAYYCGAMRLWYACKLLESYCEAKEANKKTSIALYEQMLNVIEQTRKAIDLA